MNRTRNQAYHLAEAHLFRRCGKQLLFNIESMHFYEVSSLVSDLAESVTRVPYLDPIKALKTRHRKADIRSAIGFLMAEDILREGAAPDHRSRPVLKKRVGLRHLELMVTHGCNMRCRYCYGCDDHDGWQGAQHLYGAATMGMPYEIARKGVDFLFANSGREKELSVIFFGGEPLLEFRLIKKIVRYIRDRETVTGKHVNLSLVTNGVLLKQKVVDFLVEHRIGCQISIDGPRDIHDKNRWLASGKGSYERVMPGVKRLMAARPGRVPARVTITGNEVHLPEIVDHLLNLGFGSVHAEPVIGPWSTGITREDVEEIKRQNEKLALYLARRVYSDRTFDYSNLVRFIRQTRVIDQRLAHYCGAARTYIALAQDGGFYPCHRFVGMDEYRMGDVHGGFDSALQHTMVDLTVDERADCKDCWARYLCGGGCWKHGVDSNGGLERPDELSCDITRHQIECAMAVNSQLRISDDVILGHTQ